MSSQLRYAQPLEIEIEVKIRTQVTEIRQYFCD